jgi:predicted enzyme related to lactoylglutathione lyase
MAFYSAVFGWSIDELPPEAGGYAIFTKGGKQVAGVGPQMSEGAPVAWLTYVATDDIDASVAAARAAGATVLAEPMQVLDSGWLSVLSDPGGGVFALWKAGNHLGAQIANEPATFTWSELHTRHLDASTSFYDALFGWTAKPEDFGADFDYTVFLLGDHEVGGMMPMPEGVPPQVGAYWLTYFAVDNADETVTRVIDGGGSVVVAPTDMPVGRLAIVTDPLGATFAVIEMSGAPSPTESTTV